MSVLLPTNSQIIGPVTALNIIKAIEGLGGSRGYLEHLKSTSSVNQIAQPLSLLSISNSLNSTTESTDHHHNCSIYLRVGFIPGMLFGHINVFNKPEGDGPVRVSYTTKITAWVTQGTGFTDLHGTFVGPTGWDDMLKGPIKFVITASDKKGLHATFRRDWVTAAEISADFPEASGVQDGSYTCEGECEWHQIFYKD
ncbi:unnamed protein product [Rhizoctonia solani]|uniref:Uncharacterized protein n=1 Tax=Rhizoctonia solani TaxID=456999 RepID=A0A8H3D0K0_9AGAM|nr:unnamed protein product [Rhizoctonia solani]